MIKKIIVILSVVWILGSVLFGIGYFLSNNDSGSVEQSLKTELNLGEFNSIEVKVKAADIKIQEGDTFSISYTLHDRERVKQAEVVDGTLYFVTGFDINWKVDFDDWNICITLPKGRTLEDLSLSTIDGDIEFDGRTIDIANLKSTSGNIKLTNIIAEQVNCEVTSGEISITESQVTEATGVGKATDIYFDGSFENVTINTVSGSCKLNSDTIKDISIRSVSGNIETTTPSTGISAKSYGKITYNGEKQGGEFSLSDNKSALNLISASGKIEIQTK